MRLSGARAEREAHLDAKRLRPDRNYLDDCFRLVSVAVLFILLVGSLTYVPRARFPAIPARENHPVQFVLKLLQCRRRRPAYDLANVSNGGDSSVGNPFVERVLRDTLGDTNKITIFSTNYGSYTYVCGSEPRPGSVSLSTSFKQEARPGVELPPAIIDLFED